MGAFCCHACNQTKSQITINNGPRLVMHLKLLAEWETVYDPGKSGSV